ncbi:MAG TPA: thioredoxin domain-containing protein [Candidatus Limnocylindrales bacterium]|jgi:protein-disulfide isomerase|nr:thioredoxin domain-containing protein [Candidatus Limnocylindrales bacterium]
MKQIAAFVAAVMIFAALSGPAHAADASSLKPPPGARVAVVVFEDLECPDCARAYPPVWEVAKAHKVPVVLHDFPLPRHPWSFDAAVWARYFDTKDTKTQQVGNDFRGYIYSNQPQITRENLNQFVQKFGDEHNLPVPAEKDPDGNLSAKVKEDYALGQRIGLEHTPTIFVVGNGGASTPFVEVVDRDKLSQIIEDMLKKAGPPTPGKKTVQKTSKRKS